MTVSWEREGSPAKRHLDSEGHGATASFPNMWKQGDTSTNTAHCGTPPTRTASGPPDPLQPTGISYCHQETSQPCLPAFGYQPPAEKPRVPERDYYSFTQRDVHIRDTLENQLSSQGTGPRQWLCVRCVSHAEAEQQTSRPS